MWTGPRYQGVQRVTTIGELISAGRITRDTPVLGWIGCTADQCIIGLGDQSVVYFPDEPTKPYTASLRFVDRRTGMEHTPARFSSPYSTPEAAKAAAQ